MRHDYGQCWECGENDYLSVFHYCADCQRQLDYDYELQARISE